MPARILLVDDEPNIQAAVRPLLAASGYEVLSAMTGRAALDAVERHAPDVIVLDLGLPDMDGIEVCRLIREEHPTPIIVLSARLAEQDKVHALDAGADDYVTKPFGTKELLARIEALSRRAAAEPSGPSIIEADGCRFDLGRCTAERDGQRIGLTARESEILRCLHERRSRAVGRAELLERVWGARGDLQTRTVDMTIANLRQKIERDPATPLIVITVKGKMVERLHLVQARRTVAIASAIDAVRQTEEEWF